MSSTKAQTSRSEKAELRRKFAAFSSAIFLILIITAFALNFLQENHLLSLYSVKNVAKNSAKGYRRGYAATRRGKITQFGNDFKVTIDLHHHHPTNIDDTYDPLTSFEDVIFPFRKITGKVQIETEVPIKHRGILIQFEGTCCLRYRTKFDNRVAFQGGRECILEGTKEYSKGYQESPIRQVLCDILPVKEACKELQLIKLSSGATTSTAPHLLEEGCQEFPFTLEIPGDPQLPAPFKDIYGSLVYRLAVYMIHIDWMEHVEVGEKLMRFQGHYNLSLNPSCERPISIENYYRSGLFSSKRIVEAVLEVESSGYLPLEKVPFVLKVKNPKCYRLELEVGIVQYTKYNATGMQDAAKSSEVTIEFRKKLVKETFEQTEFEWEEKLWIPYGTGPSFTVHRMYNVSYTLQLKVKIPEKGVLKGEAPLYIGSTRDSLKLLKAKAEKGTAFGFYTPVRGLSRRSSVNSLRSVDSFRSTRTVLSLPPAYSQLSSRRESFETLPPAYSRLELLGLEPCPGKPSEIFDNDKVEIGDDDIPPISAPCEENQLKTEGKVPEVESAIKDMTIDE